MTYVICLHRLRFRWAFQSSVRPGRRSRVYNRCFQVAGEFEKIENMMDIWYIYGTCMVHVVCIFQILQVCQHFWGEIDHGIRICLICGLGHESYMATRPTTVKWHLNWCTGWVQIRWAAQARNRAECGASKPADTSRCSGRKKACFDFDMLNMLNMLKMLNAFHVLNGMLIMLSLVLSLSSPGPSRKMWCMEALPGEDFSAVFASTFEGKSLQLRNSQLYYFCWGVWFWISPSNICHRSHIFRDDPVASVSTFLQLLNATYCARSSEPYEEQKASLHFSCF